MARPAAEKLTPDEVADLERQYYEVSQAEDDAGRQLAREIAARLRKIGPHFRCRGDDGGPEPMITFDAPLGPHKDDKGNRTPITINRKQYKGRITVPLCTYREIMRLADQAWRLDRERMNEGGHVYDLGTVDARAQRIQAET